MATNPIYPYHLFGIYVIELGRFFRQKFTDVKIHGSGQTLSTQVFFGTPRAAFRYYFDKFNGQIIMPMINYQLIDVERKPEFEPTYVNLYSKESYNPETGTMEMMRAPGVFELTYNVTLWNNNQRERDYFVHAIYNAFPKGEVHLIYFPDYDNYPDVFLQMPHTMESTLSDETEIEGLDQGETRDQIKTTYMLRCTRAFVPYDAVNVNVVSTVIFQDKINSFVSGTYENEFTSSFVAGLAMRIHIRVIPEDVTVTTS